MSKSSGGINGNYTWFFSRRLRFESSPELEPQNMHNVQL